MGIYTNGHIYGIRIYTYTVDEDSHILYEKQYNTIMTPEQRNEAYLFYSELYDKLNVFFQIYTECSSTYTYGSGNYRAWHPLSSTNVFLEQFGSIVVFPKKRGTSFVGEL